MSQEYGISENEIAFPSLFVTSIKSFQGSHRFAKLATIVTKCLRVLYSLKRLGAKFFNVKDLAKGQTKNNRIYIFKLNSGECVIKG